MRVFFIIIFLWPLYLTLADDKIGDDTLDLWSLPEFSITMSELSESMYIHGYNNVEVFTDFSVLDFNRCLLKNNEESIYDFEITYSVYLDEVAIMDMKKILSDKSYFVCREFSYVSEPNLEGAQSFHSFISEDGSVRFQIYAFYAN